MSDFVLHSYKRIDEMGCHYGSTRLEFMGKSLKLYDGYELDDSDGDRIYEGDDYYTIQSEYYENILSNSPDEYKNELILEKSEAAYNFYNELLTVKEKTLFLCVLNFNNYCIGFNSLLKFLNHNNIPFEHKQLRY